MLYIKCKKCNRYVPPRIHKCPHCGNIVRDYKTIGLLKRVLRKFLRRSH